MWFEGISDLEVSVPDFESSVPSNRGEVWLEVSFRGLVFKDWGISDA